MLAVMVMALLHEAAHWVAGAALGDRSTMYSFGVDQGATGMHAVVTAAAGPLLSLVTGAMLYLWQPLRRSAGVGHLVWIWLAMVCLQEAMTYLVLTPLAGDTKTIADNLHLPLVAQFIAVAIGIAGMFLTARLFAPLVREVVGGDLRDIRAMTLMPWLLGSVVLVANGLLQLSVANMPVSTADQIAIMANNTAIGVFAPMAIPMAFKATRAVLPMRFPAFPSGVAIGFIALVGLGVAMRNCIAIR